MSQRDHASPGEGGGIDDRSRLELLRVRQHVREHQSAFRVGVDDLDELARHAAHDVARLDRGTGRHVGGGADESHDIDRQLQPGYRFHGAQHAGGAAHVELHPLHALRRLDGDATGVEAQSLADERDGLGARRTAEVLECDELRILRRSLRHTEEATHAKLLHLGAALHRDREAVPFTDLPRGVCEKLGRAEIAGHHAKGARKPMPLGNRDATGEARGVGAENARARQRCAPFIRGRSRLRVEIIPGARGKADGERFCLHDVQPTGEERELAHAHASPLPCGERAGATQPPGALTGGSGPDEENASRAHCSTREMQGLITGAAEIPAIQRAGERATERRVERRELAVDARAGGQDDDEQRTVETPEFGGPAGEGQHHVVDGVR